MTEMTGGTMELTAEPGDGLVDGPVTRRVAGVPRAAVAIDAAGPGERVGGPERLNQKVDG